MSFKLISDSCANLPDEMLAEYDIDIMSLTVRCGQDEYYSYIKGQPTDNKKFYTMMREGKTLETSHLVMIECRELFESYLKEGFDIFYLAFSSALSGTYNVATLVANELSQEYPDRKIYVVDSKCASMGQGLLLTFVAKMRKEGQDIDTIKEWTEQNKLNLCHWFTVDDLFHLKRGGRVSATTAIVGSVLGIKPILHVDDEGKLINVDKVRGRTKSIDSLAKHLCDSIVDSENQTIFISHGDCEQEAEYLAKKVYELVKVKDIKINCIDPVIGAHAGPGTLAIFFMGNKR